MDPTTGLVLLGASFVFARLLWNYLRSPLKSFPGPLAARFTNVWRLQDVFRGRCDITHNQLHRMHGSAVCMGPNVLSLSDPALINLVYTTRDPWSKSDMYNVNDALIGGTRIKNIFSHQDEKWHAKYIRPVKSLYSMTRVQDLEPGVDKTISLFLDKIRERFIRTGQPCEMSDYISYFAWDAMSQITFSQNLGILEAGSDYRKILETSSKSLDYFASVCQIPRLDLWLDKNPICRVGPPSFGWTVQFSIEQMQKRYRDGKPAQHEYLDFLDRYLAAKEKSPDIVDDNTVMMYLIANITAGSDTTASTMCAAVYYVLRHRAVHDRLREELRGASLTMPAQWKEIRDLPYLDAVMRESMRVHPGVGLLVERIVPRGGFTLPDGRFVPEGTIVGMNPWVINRDSAVFGEEPDSFIPERWLAAMDESHEAFQARLSKMKNTEFTFGAGPRVCLGQYISQLESYKFIATLFSKISMELSHANSDWKVTNSWFVRQENMPVVVKDARD